MFIIATFFFLIGLAVGYIVFASPGSFQSVDLRQRQEDDLKRYRDPLTGLPLRMNKTLWILRGLGQSSSGRRLALLDERDIVDAANLGMVSYLVHDGATYIMWNVRAEKALLDKLNAA